MTPSLPLRVRWALQRKRLEFSGHPVLQKLGRALYVAERYLRGARPVEMAGFEKTAGEIVEYGLEISWGGACPVHGEGLVDGRACDYRSRGESWSFSVYRGPKSEDMEIPTWEHAERPYLFPQGGWVAPYISEACIRRAVSLWRRAGRP
jgi:hypothetical protein